LATFVETTLKGIDDRLKSLRQEVQQLEAAKAALTGARRGPGRPPGARTRRTRRAAATTTTTRPARTTTRRRAGATRGRRSGGATRANQALELVKSKPGITIPEIAKAMGIEPNYLYRVLPKLAKDGTVKRQGQGWHPGS
jgi:CRP-like cAMP-binding protein